MNWFTCIDGNLGRSETTWLRTVVIDTVIVRQSFCKNAPAAAPGHKR